MQRFYGGDPERWTRMVPALFAMYAGMLSRLQAEESLELVNATAAGAGTLEKHARNGYLAELGRDAKGQVRAAKPTLGQLARMGVQVIHEDSDGNAAEPEADSGGG